MPTTASSDYYVGKPSLAIPIQYVKAALTLLIAGAKRLQQQKIIHDKMHESSEITPRLASEMIAEQRAGYCDIIRFDFEVEHLSNPADPKSVCRLDFKFTWNNYDYEAYLAVEAKRLRGKGKSLAYKYVDEGVMDFVDGKYSRGHNYGIMIGYVVLAPLDNAVAKVITAMNARKTATYENSPCRIDNSFCSHPYTHHSSHLQPGRTKPIILIHIFFDFSDS